MTYLLDGLELEQRVNALDRQTALLHAFLPLARDSETRRTFVLAANLNLRVYSLRYLFGILFSSVPLEEPRRRHTCEADAAGGGRGLGAVARRSTIPTRTTDKRANRRQKGAFAGAFVILVAAGRAKFTHAYGLDSIFRHSFPRIARP